MGINKRTRPIIAKFARYYTRRKVFVNKKRLKILEFQLPKDLPNTGWNLKKKQKEKNKFRFNKVWTVDGRIYYYDEVAGKVKVYFD